MSSEAKDSCEVICLSSDSENEVEEIENWKITKMRNDLKQIHSFTSKKTSPPVDRNCSETKRLNGHVTLLGKCEESEDGPLTVNLDDESDLEVEYDNQDDKGSEGKNSVIISDEEIQVVNDDLSSSNVSPIIKKSVSVIGNGIGGKPNGIETDPVDEPPAEENVPVLEVEGDEIDEDMEEVVDLSPEECAENTKKALQNLVLEIRIRKFKNITPKHCDKLKARLDQSFEKIKNVSVFAHMRFQDEIEETKRTIILTDNVWTNIKKLLEFMEPQVLERILEEPDEIRKIRKNREKEKLVEKYERHLLRYQRKIRELAEAEVDWDDLENDHNSQYLQQDKLEKKILKLYYNLCDLTKCSHLTGRPVQLRVNLKKQNAGSGYDDIDAAIEKSVNSKGYMLNVPDFTEILEIVSQTNKTKGLRLDSDAEFALAEKLFRNVVNIIKRRREKDFSMNMLSYITRKVESSNEKEDNEYQELPEDPADINPELKEKLDENKKLAKSEAEIIEEFVKRSENAGKKREKNEDHSSSPTPHSTTDNDGNSIEDEAEEDDDDDDADCEVAEDAIEEDDGEQQNLSAHQYAELTEDEDEEPETVRGPSSWSIGKDFDENDDVTTAGESESEVKASQMGMESDVAAESDSSVDKVKKSEVAKILVKRPSSENLEDSPAHKRPRTADENSNEPNDAAVMKEQSS